jgi:polyhydroxyalkanoate synthesis regulator phasin
MKKLNVAVFALFCAVSMSTYATESENPQKICEDYAAEAEISKEEIASYMDECIQSINSSEENNDTTKEEPKD